MMLVNSVLWLVSVHIFSYSNLENDGQTMEFLHFWKQRDTSGSLLKKK